MQVEAFWKHWKVREDPFRAEEARHDPVLARMVDSEITHPDFQKVFGHAERPSAAVVFGEKGSGKTALRLLLEKRYAEHNAAHPDAKVWVVRYDDLNPVLDRFTQTLAKKRNGDPLAGFTLSEHQDAILSLLTTKLVSSLLNEDGAEPLPPGYLKTARRMSRNRRVDLALLAALYDQPRSGSFDQRWSRLSRIVRLSWVPRLAAEKWFGILLAGVALAIYLIGLVSKPGDPTLHTVMISLCLAGALLLLGHWAYRSIGLWSLVRQVRRELKVVQRSPAELRRALAEFPARELHGEPVPKGGDQDSRYQLTHRLLEVLEPLGYRGVVVLIDRVDEPAMVNGDAKKMQALVWPMFNNKFLQQDRIGIKMLLPIELRHLLRREDAEFYQQARLDKQHMIDKLVWSGATLYDVCTRRLQACLENDAPRISLTDLFEQDVTKQDLIDALDQMLQPRDCFKFLYQVIQEHCSNVPHDQPAWRIPRATLMHVRKAQSTRVQELGRGLAPA
jgi:hypothetical protein